MFLVGGLVLFFLAKWTAEWLGGYIVRNPSDLVTGGIGVLVALSVGIALYRHERIYTMASDVIGELKKVTWPTRKETLVATRVVIIMSVISALILYTFDAVWSTVTDLIYG